MSARWPKNIPPDVEQKRAELLMDKNLAESEMRTHDYHRWEDNFAPSDVYHAYAKLQHRVSNANRKLAQLRKSLKKKPKAADGCGEHGT